MNWIKEQRERVSKPYKISLAVECRDSGSLITISLTKEYDTSAHMTEWCKDDECEATATRMVDYLVEKIEAAKSREETLEITRGHFQDALSKR